MENKNRKDCCIHMDDNTKMEGCAQKDDTIRMENGVPLDTTTGMENSAQVKNKTQNDDTVPTEQAQAAEMKEEKKCYCCHKKKERSEKEYKDLIHRLNRIEGQIRGIRNMVEQDAYCPDILIQVAAANAALNSFNKVLLGNHLRTCVANDIREGHDETIDELLKVLQRLMK